MKSPKPNWDLRCIFRAAREKFISRTQSFCEIHFSIARIHALNPHRAIFIYFSARQICICSEKKNNIKLSVRRFGPALLVLKAIYPLFVLGRCIVFAFYCFVWISSNSVSFSLFFHFYYICLYSVPATVRRTKSSIASFYIAFNVFAFCCCGCCFFHPFFVAAAWNC